MDAARLIELARSENRNTLNEAESKQVLSAYGVPAIDEAVARSPDEAASLAERFGFPVVIKALGASLTHKTEMGLVRLGLGSAAEVRRAARKIASAAGNSLEGWIVQPQLAGRREFVAGLFRDPQFGPVVMFGLGGIFTEALDDVVFRLAPLDEAEAGRMLDELNSSRLLGAFRGESEARRDALIRALTGLARLGLEHPEVAEVDINPLLVTPDGTCQAVDALIVLADPAETAVRRPPVAPERIEPLFYPRSVVFVGASADIRKWGHMLFSNVLAGGYEGQVYLVGSRGGALAGRTLYRSLDEVPGPADLAVVTVPAAAVEGLIPGLRAKGVKGLVLITSGFSETGQEGRDLESRVVEAAREAGILILGPNTMGISNPYHKFHCTGTPVHPAPGPTAFVSQSGNMGGQLLTFAEQQGIGIRAFGGSGNEAMFTIEDALDAFAVDRLTRTVLLYVESVKDGRRFYESARQVSRRKPIIVLKGGRTEAGGRAAASHTGAMASNIRVFNAACRQAGVVLADQPMDLLDLSAAFSCLPLPQGRRVAVMTLGGGWGVVTADLCHEYGLEIPLLSEEIIRRIDQVLPPFWSRSNPVDLVSDTSPQAPVQVLEDLLAWDGCDAVINLGIYGRRLYVSRLAEAERRINPHPDEGYLETVRKAIEQFEHLYVQRMVRLMEQHGKPIIGVSLVTDESDKTVLDVVPKSRYKGVFFKTPERAVKVLSAMCRYAGWLEAGGA